MERQNLVINKCVKLVVEEIRAELVEVKIRDKSENLCDYRGKLEIQVITLPLCRCVALKRFKSLGTFRYSGPLNN